MFVYFGLGVGRIGGAMQRFKRPRYDRSRQKSYQATSYTQPSLKG